MDAFLSGAKEPTCEQLRDMWRVARELQRQRSIRTNEVPQDASESNFVRFPEDEEEDSAGFESSNPKADRRRLSVPPHVRGKNAASSKKEVYGVVRTHAPPARSSSLHVRDPAKEIYGLLRERTASTKVAPASSKPQYGKVLTHHELEEKEGQEEEEEYFNELRDKLMRERVEAGEAPPPGNGSQFGVVRYSEPRTPTPSSSLDRLRAILEQEREEEGDDKGRSDSFDVIRQRLMSTRLNSGRRSASDRLRGARRKALLGRRKGATQRTRTVSKIRDLIAGQKLYRR